MLSLKFQKIFFADTVAAVVEVIEEEICVAAVEEDNAVVEFDVEFVGANVDVSPVPVPVGDVVEAEDVDAVEDAVVEGDVVANVVVVVGGVVGKASFALI